MTEPVVRLRPFTAADVETLIAWRAHTETDDHYSFFGHKALDGMHESFAKDGFLSPDNGRLLVELPDGTPIGDVGWYRASDWGPGARVLSIGITLIPEHRGKGYGAAAQRQLADYLLATEPLNRIEASTDVENIAEQRSLEKAGFTREGVVRGAQWRAGAYHDMVLYSRLRSD